jgi:hypothetical protein
MYSRMKKGLTIEQKRARARVSKTSERAYFMFGLGCKRLSDVYVHPEDMQKVANYIDAANAKRFRGRRPPRIIKAPPPRGGYTKQQSAEMLGRDVGYVERCLRKGVLKYLPRHGGRQRYVSGESIRHEKRLLEALALLTTDQAAAYLSSRGVHVAAKTLINWRYKGIGPKAKLLPRHNTRYSPRELDRWMNART